MTMLLDALVAMGLVTKDTDRYASAQGIVDVLSDTSSNGVLALVQHQANCMRSWAQLAKVVKTGQPPPREPSIRGPKADLEAFIEAMNELCIRMAPELVEALGPPAFRHLLDLGGGPATWTIAMLRGAGQATATLFDLPDVIPIARKHITEAGLADRVEFVAGDMMSDEPLPSGADLAWVSAIIHMNSRQENRQLFAKIHAALADGGRILIRDVVMDDSHLVPPDGAMFAVNMLVNTPGGDTYSLAEISEDLVSAGFTEPALLHKGQFMDSVVQAIKLA